MVNSAKYILYGLGLYLTIRAAAAVYHGIKELVDPTWKKINAQTQMRIEEMSDVGYETTKQIFRLYRDTESSAYLDVAGSEVPTKETKRWAIEVDPAEVVTKDNHLDDIIKNIETNVLELNHGSAYSFSDFTAKNKKLAFDLIGLEIIGNNKQYN